MVYTRMQLFNDKWEIYISKVQYDPKSADNIVSPDSYVEICDDFSTTLMLTISDVMHSFEKNIVFRVSYYTPYSDFAFMDGNRLFLFLNTDVVIFNLKSFQVDKKVKLNIWGTLFAAYSYQEDFILYYEADIIRMNRNLDVIWDFSAHEIFVRYHGEEPAFEMCPDRIKLYDFSDYYYEIDYDGKLIGD